MPPYESPSVGYRSNGGVTQDPNFRIGSEGRSDSRSGSRSGSSGSRSGGGGTFGPGPHTSSHTSKPTDQTPDQYFEEMGATDVGQTLWDGLEMPEVYEDGSRSFLMSIDEDNTPTSSYYYQAGHGTQVVQYTVAGGVEWLRGQAVNNTEGYNSIVASLYQAGYLSEADVRFGRFTGKVAQAFAEAAWDTANANMGRDPGEVITIFDHLDGIIAGFEESGFGPNGPGGGGDGPQAPTRVDQWSDPETLRETIRQSAQAALGRNLTDQEEQAFLSNFHGKEASWNDDRWAAEQAQFNGQSADVVDRPNANAAGDAFIRKDPKLAQEKAGEDMGSYVNVMARMFGLGGEGIGIA